jgi:hypothetical protein
MLGPTQQSQLATFITGLIFHPSIKTHSYMHAWHNIKMNIIHHVPVGGAMVVDGPCILSTTEGNYEW